MQSGFIFNNLTTNVLPKDGELLIYKGIIQQEFTHLYELITWKHEKIFIFGQWRLQPRLTAWYGDEGTDYQYSGLNNQPLAWPNTLLTLKENVERIAGKSFNSMLANCYRNGQDSMGWHQDNEQALGPNPVIASVSLGETRQFQLKHKYDKSLKTIKLELLHGDLLIMRGQTQNFWLHQVPKTKREVNARINLTFRTII